MLEAGTKIREAENYYPGFGHLRLLVTGVAVWLPGMFARDSEWSDFLCVCLVDNRLDS